MEHAIKSTFLRRWNKGESIKISYLVPGRHKGVDKLLLGIITRIKFRDGSKLRGGWSALSVILDCSHDLSSQLLLFRREGGFQFMIVECALLVGGFIFQGGAFGQLSGYFIQCG